MPITYYVGRHCMVQRRGQQMEQQRMLRKGQRCKPGLHVKGQQVPRKRERSKILNRQI